MKEEEKSKASPEQKEAMLPLSSAQESPEKKDQQEIDKSLTIEYKTWKVCSENFAKIPADPKMERMRIELK